MLSYDYLSSIFTSLIPGNTARWFPIRWSEKLKIGIVIWWGKQKLTVDMGFKKSKTLSKILKSRLTTGGPKLSKIGIFNENGLFSVIIFLQSTISMPCHILLERNCKTEQNGIYSIEIYSWYDEHITTLILPPISWLVAKTKSVKNS